MGALKKLGLMFQQSYDIATSVLSNLTASECALVMVLTGYQPSTSERFRLLNLLRDMPLLEDGVKRAHEEGTDFVLVGADVRYLLDRVNDPKLYWSACETIEELQVWLMPFKIINEKPVATVFDDGNTVRDKYWHKLCASDRQDVSVWVNVGSAYTDSILSHSEFLGWPELFNSVEVETNGSYSRGGNSRRCSCNDISKCWRHRNILYGPSLATTDAKGRSYTCVTSLANPTRDCHKVYEQRYPEPDSTRDSVQLSVLYNDVAYPRGPGRPVGMYYITV